MILVTAFAIIFTTCATTGSGSNLSLQDAIDSAKVPVTVRGQKRGVAISDSHRLRHTDEFPQYLEPGDIEIYINGYRQIVDVVFERINFARHNSIEHQEEFYELFENQFSLMVLSRRYGLIIPDSPDIYDNGNFLYNNGDGGNFRNLINCSVPEDLEILFRMIGWDNDGHKKFWTIYCYYRYIQMTIERMNWHSNDVSGHLLNLIDGRMDFSNNLFTDYQRLFEKLNSNDVKLIISHWDKFGNIYNVN